MDPLLVKGLVHIANQFGLQRRPADPSTVIQIAVRQFFMEQYSVDLAERPDIWARLREEGLVT